MTSFRRLGGRGMPPAGTLTHGALVRRAASMSKATSDGRIRSAFNVESRSIFGNGKLALMNSMLTEMDVASRHSSEAEYDGIRM